MIALRSLVIIAITLAFFVALAPGQAWAPVPSRDCGISTPTARLFNIKAYQIRCRAGAPVRPPLPRRACQAERLQLPKVGRDTRIAFLAPGRQGFFRDPALTGNSAARSRVVSCDLPIPSGCSGWRPPVLDRLVRALAVLWQELSSPATAGGRLPGPLRPCAASRPVEIGLRRRRRVHCSRGYSWPASWGRGARSTNFAPTFVFIAFLVGLSVRQRAARKCLRQLQSLACARAATGWFLTRAAGESRCHRLYPERLGWPAVAAAASRWIDSRQSGARTHDPGHRVPVTRS